MPATLSAGDLFGELATLTSMDAGEWRDFLSLPPAGQAIAAQVYRDASWAKSADTLPKIIAILETLGTIAGVVSGVSGAVGAVAALRNAFKS